MDSIAEIISGRLCDPARRISIGLLPTDSYQQKDDFGKGWGDLCQHKVAADKDGRNPLEKHNALFELKRQ